MGGVFATTRPDLWEHRTRDLVAGLGYRGADGCQVWRDRQGSVLFMHASLASTGPGAPSGSDDDELFAAHDGSVLNFGEIARDLGVASRVPEGAVVAEAIQRWGVDGIARFRGSYTVVAWDAARRRLIGARDPFGAKPLYHLDHPTGGVTICSALPPLLSLAKMTIDPIGLAHYVVFGHTGPHLTLWERVRKVAPGAAWEWCVDDGGHRSCRARRVPRDALMATIGAPPPTLGEALVGSVAAHLPADVDVGILVSGGPASALVAAVAASMAPRIRTFTLSVPGLPRSEEADVCEATARALGTEHRTVRAGPRALVEAATAAMAVSGEPAGDPRMLCLAVLSEAIAEEAKVVLSGGGARAVLGSHRTSLASPSILGGSSRRHPPLRDADVGALPGPGKWPLSDVLNLMRSDWASVRADERWVSPLRAFDLAMLPPSVTEPTDAMTTASSVEVRLPWLDAAVVRAVGGRSPRAAGQLVQQELRRRVPGVARHEKTRIAGPELVNVVTAELQEERSFQLLSRDSVLRRELGEEVAEFVRARCASSSVTAFRVAMLGIWESAFWSR